MIGLLMKNPNPKQERMMYIRELYNHFMGVIYARQKKAQQEELYKIAEKNQILLKTNTATFIFEGNWYPDMQTRYTFSDKNNMQLHPSLREEVRQIVHCKSFFEFSNKAHVSFMLQNSLNKAHCITDLRRLLSGELLTNFPLEYDIFDIGDPLPDEDIALIQEENKEGILCLNKLLITNLLLYK